ncbi:hypothetical protein DFH08DRAFT_817114 [Mycena albidolilacea]|uniref:DUF6534 domain-containing protein n=1 Tax=Mycena albidolilacea TaxID=1033008 RepID=A0AAD6ZIQ7_9AGAR|nr:hypothetical protein DFH08DRAFT_817114 [Mycena albidolilacea]
MSFNSDIILGALLVGTGANSVLYTVEVIQAFAGIVCHRDRFRVGDRKLCLCISLHNHSLGRFGVSAEPVLGKSFRSYWKKHNQTHIIEQPYPLYVFTTGVVAALVQSFLAVRYWLLSKNKFITLTLFLFITVAIGGAFASAVTLAIFPGYKDRETVLIPATTWLIAEAVTDISIASALLLEFWKARSSFREIRSLLHKLAAQTILTGTTGATIALAVLVAFLENNGTNGGFPGLPPSIPGSHIQVSTGIAYCLGRVYCITMLANLNRRKPRTWSSKCMYSGASPETRGEPGNHERSEGGDEYGGIRGFLVNIDTPREFSRGSLKTNPGQGLPYDSPAVEIEMTVNDSASYLSKKKQDLFAA